MLSRFFFSPDSFRLGVCVWQKNQTGHRACEPMALTSHITGTSSFPASRDTPVDQVIAARKALDVILDFRSDPGNFNRRRE